MTSTSRRLLLFYNPSIRTAGVGTFVGTLGTIMLERGWDVTIGLAWGTRFHDPRYFEEAFPALPTLWMDGRSGTAEGRVGAIARAIGKVRPTVALQTALYDAFEGARRARALGASFTFVSAVRGSLAHEVAAVVENQDVADHAVFVNQLSHRAMLSVAGGLPASRAHYIPNGILLPDQRIAGKDHPPRIGYAGRLADDKRFGDFLPLFDELARHEPRAEAWIAGDGPLETSLRKFAARHSGRVRYFGHLQRAELNDTFYPGIDALVHFSPTEGWSQTIGEAMAHGIVPVTSEFTSIHSEGLLHHGANALVFPVGDTKTGARLLADLLREAGRRRALGDAARETIAASFTRQHFAERWACFLEQAHRERTGLVSERAGGAARLTRRLRIATSADALRERVRRVLGRRFVHEWDNSEWPKLRANDAALTEAVSRCMASVESEALRAIGLEQVT